MYSTSTHKGIRGMIAAMALTAAFAATPALAEVIVVKAIGPSSGGFPAGKKLADKSTLTLKAGDTLTVLDGQGTRTLRGPGTFGTSAPPTAGTDTRNSLASLMAPKAVGRVRTGAVRGAFGEAPPPRSPNLWYVDVSQASTACVPDPSNVILWRPQADAAVTVTATAKGGKSAPIMFDMNRSVAPWPADLPVTEGATYTLNWQGLAKPITISFSLMNGQDQGLESMASTLIAHKCSAQLDLLVQTVALPDPAPINPVG